MNEHFPNMLFHILSATLTEKDFQMVRKWLIGFLIVKTRFLQSVCSIINHAYSTCVKWSQLPIQLSGLELRSVSFIIILMFLHQHVMYFTPISLKKCLTLGLKIFSIIDLEQNDFNVFCDKVISYSFGKVWMVK